MPPNLTSGVLLAEATLCSTLPPYNSTGIRSKPVAQTQPQVLPKPLVKNEDRPPRMQVVWRNVMAFFYLHAVFIYSLVFIFPRVYLSTFIFTLVYGLFAGIGITAGAHRLWAHRCYKAKWPMRLLLTIFQTAAFQNHIYEWVRDHRLHHKKTDTNADPHNASRGFFFSHIGWLMVRKHPDVRNEGKKIDMSDLDQDPFVVYQKKFYIILMPLFTFIIPTMIPVYFWGENVWMAWYICVSRYTMGLNGTWLVNSAAHIWGNKPYEKSISPTENTTVAWLAFGEGWHNYHHVFPWDYKAAELGNYKANFTTAFIDFFAKLGWAYDLKTVKADMVKRRVQRTGDSTHPKYALQHEETESETHSHHNPWGEDIWGWGDKDMKEDAMAAATILYKSD